MLTKEQIAALFDFCRKHHVHHYDIQAELVDHLANAVEEKMNTNQQLSFEVAVSNVYNNFGVKGFAEIVKTRHVTLERRYQKMREKFIRSYFTWPKAGLTVCLFLLFVFLHQRLTSDQLNTFISAVAYSLFAFLLFIMLRTVILQKKQNKKLLITETGLQTSFFIFFIAPMFLLSGHLSSKEGTAPLVNYYVYATVLVIFFIALLAYNDVCQKIHATAKQQFPEVFEK